MLTRVVGRDLVDDVLVETWRTEKRRRLLPARVVVFILAPGSGEAPVRELFRQHAGHRRSRILQPRVLARGRHHRRRLAEAGAVRAETACRAGTSRWIASVAADD
ncbi:transposase domain-containing protein [Nocardia fluminea]|uniref:transposase domain-containing protein n=1 Tax=Nocardia fluminea TaxID=134984 RepID=UPI003D0B02CA